APEFVIGFVIAAADEIISRRFGGDALGHFDSRLLDSLGNRLAGAQKYCPQPKSPSVRNLHFPDRHLLSRFRFGSNSIHGGEECESRVAAIALPDGIRYNAGPA